jgi:hypothetical protein
MGISMATVAATATSAAAVATPSATLCGPLAMSSADRPLANSSPARPFLLYGLLHVGDEVPVPGQDEEHERPAPDRDAEAGELGHTSRDERGFGVHPAAKSVGYARCDGDQVLRRGSNVTTDHVIARVHTQRVAHEHEWELGRADHVGNRDARCRGRPLHDLTGEGGAVQDADGTRVMIDEHLRRHL